MRRLYLANDCSAYHGGSWAVAEVIKTAARGAGWDVVIEADKTEVERDALMSCDAVLVNGEGTLHGGKRRARHLMGLLRIGQSEGLGTALVNTSWASMGGDHDDVLARLDALSAREPVSARTLREVHGADPSMHLDLSLQHPLSRPQGVRRTGGPLATDFYSAEFDCFVAPRGGRLAQLEALDMRAADWPKTLAAVGSAPVLITGRFHGLMAALATRTPFVAYPGNTHKVEATAAWLGAEAAVTRRPNALFGMAKTWRDRQGTYEAAFAAADDVPRWTFPL